jgi:hypothetical protein
LWFAKPTANNRYRMYCILPHVPKTTLPKRTWIPREIQNGWSISILSERKGRTDKNLRSSNPHITKIRTGNVIHDKHIYFWTMEACESYLSVRQGAGSYLVYSWYICSKDGQIWIYKVQTKSYSSFESIWYFILNLHVSCQHRMKRRRKYYYLNVKKKKRNRSISDYECVSTI